MVGEILRPLWFLILCNSNVWKAIGSSFFLFVFYSIFVVVFELALLSSASVTFKIGNLCSAILKFFFDYFINDFLLSLFRNLFLFWCWPSYSGLVIFKSFLWYSSGFVFLTPIFWIISPILSSVISVGFHLSYHIFGQSGLLRCYVCK